ncbi:MAG: hypothetical protein ACFFKA_15840, partial [Candidatus Thorarchaeota archaeon]
MELDDFAKKYISLGLRINKHINGYVEHYYGPRELKTKVNNERKSSPKKLLEDCNVLLNKIKNQGFEPRRQKFLQKNIEAMEIILRKLNGEHIPYLVQVEKLFDFKPILYRDDFFYNLTLKADELYNGKGKLHDRIAKYSEKRMIPIKDIINHYIKTIHIARERTKQCFPKLLPNNEKITISEVNNVSWLMYCWYQGNFFSKIEINVSKIHYWTNLLHFGCHEVYPGHHTERLLKEYYLFRNKGYFETSILLIYTPELVISEGMGLLAERVLFDPTESIRILLENILSNQKV